MLNGDEILEAHEQGRIKIDPWDPNHIGSNSYDVVLGTQLMVYDRTINYLDPRKKHETRSFEIPEDGYVINKNEMVLGNTFEYCYNYANDLVPMIEGRSSIGRLGLTIHVSAGFGDIMFCGRWTLEITALFMPVKVYARMPIAQLYWFKTRPTERRYNGKYQNQKDIMPSLIHLDR
jgi:dCTP deaminase